MKAAGGRLSDVAKLTVLVVEHSNDKHRVLIAEVERAFGTGLKPTCTIIPVPRLGREDQLVEIEAIGVLKNQPQNGRLQVQLGSENMQIAGADHANWRVKELERSLHFYCDILGLETFGTEAYRDDERAFVSVRVSTEFTLHLSPDPALEPHYAASDNHLALVVEGVAPDALRARLERAGLSIERSSEQALGARGNGVALYVRDPDGYLIELKIYGSYSDKS